MSSSKLLVNGITYLFKGNSVKPLMSALRYKPPKISVWTKEEFTNLIRSAKSSAHVDNIAQINKANPLLRDFGKPKASNIDNFIDEFVGKCANGSRVANILTNLKPKIQLIEDKKIREFIEKELVSVSCAKRWDAISKSEELERLVDAVNQFNKHYSAFKWSKYAEEYSTIAELSKDLRKKGIKLSDVMYKNERLPEELLANFQTIKGDLALESKLYGIRRYMAEFPNSEMSNHLYNKYYLNFLEKISTNPQAIRTAISKLKYIDSKFGVKVILPSKFKMTDFNESMDFIEKELIQWQKWGNGKEKLPPVINFSAVSKLSFYDLAFHSPKGNGTIRIPQMNIKRLQKALRHELTHLNDLKHGKDIPSKYNLDEIFPKKVKTNANGIPILDSKGEKIMELDYSKCKYVEDFKRIGIESEVAIRYAHNNIKEFVAVAGESDLSKCSPEFKQVLIDFGMPEWRFQAA